MSGQLKDPPINQNGINLVNNYIKQNAYPKYPGHCFASNLQRTKQTLQLIYPKALISQRIELNEISFGETEYMTKEELIKTNRIGFSFDYDSKICDSAESSFGFIKRVTNDFIKLLDYWYDNQMETITICGHGGHLLGLSIGFDIKGMPRTTNHICNNCQGIVLEVNKINNEYSLKLRDVIGGSKEEVFNLKGE